MIEEGFKSDGCTLFPEGDWHMCCVQHDYNLFEGMASIDAHKLLFKCVAEIDPLIGGIMFIGVLLFYPVIKFMKKRRENVKFNP